MIHHLDSDEGLTAGNIYTNANAEGGIRLDLPPANQEEASLTVAVHAPHRVLLVAQGSDKVFLGSTAATGIEADAVGSHILLVCTRSGRWTALHEGNWAFSA